MNSTRLYIGIMLKKYLRDFNDTRLILSVMEMFDIGEWDSILSLRKFCSSDVEWQINLGFEIPMKPYLKGAKEDKTQQQKIK
jgi:hypothetical protein